MHDTFRNEALEWLGRSLGAPVRSDDIIQMKGATSSSRGRRCRPLPHQPRPDARASGGGPVLALLHPVGRRVFVPSLLGRRRHPRCGQTAAEILPALARLWTERHPCACAQGSAGEASRRGDDASMTARLWLCRGQKKNPVTQPGAGERLCVVLEACRGGASQAA